MIQTNIEKYVAKPNYKRTTSITENLVAVHTNKTKIVFDKPIYASMSILDLSKSLIYEFHYHIMKTKYEDTIEIYYKDTDLLIYLI